MWLFAVPLSPFFVLPLFVLPLFVVTLVVHNSAKQPLKARFIFSLGLAAIFLFVAVIAFFHPTDGLEELWKILLVFAFFALVLAAWSHKLLTGKLTQDDVPPFIRLMCEGANAGKEQEKEEGFIRGR